MNKTQLKQHVLTIVGFLTIVAVCGLLVMVTGIVPIKASSGHWPITKWILAFSKDRSVATHSAGIEVPSLDDPSLVIKGAGHYEVGCAPCHGSPAQSASPIALSMTATPPSLPEKIPDRSPEELFYIVKHGILFTGMPAWPALNRDDEVWAVVAFLRELPKMKRDTYRHFTLDTIDVPFTEEQPDVSMATLERCIRCHGRDGLGRDEGVFPKLAGQKRDYLKESLRAYADGERHSGMMQPLAAVESEETLVELADYFAGLPPSGKSETNDAERENDSERSESIRRGRAIVEKGIPERGVGSCVACHGPSDFATASTYPRLAGQYADYLVLQLKLFQEGRRGGTESAHLMQPIVQGLKEQDIEDVAAYYASLTPE